MKKNYEKNEASHIGKKNSAIMIVTLLAVTLFIGTAIQPAIAVSISSSHSDTETVEEECLPCKPEVQPKDGGECKTCAEAVVFTVDYMKDYVKTELWKNFQEHGWWFYWPLDAVTLIFIGLNKGIKESGFEFEIDYNDLKEHINKTIEDLIGPQMFPFTKFLATLSAISIGITTYLVSCCTDGSTSKSIEDTNPTPSPKSVGHGFFKWIMVLRLLRI